MTTNRVSRKKLLSALFCLSFLMIVTISLAAVAAAGSESSERWVGTWAASQQLVERHNLPPEPGLAYNTLRQVVRVSIGGDQLRLKLSNQYGISELEIESVHIAQSAGGHRIVPETGKYVTFSGKQSVTIDPIETVVSDPIEFSLDPLSTVAITIKFGDVPRTITGHPGSRTTSYIVPGNGVDLESMPNAVTTERWYIIAGIDVLADSPDCAAVVVLGDSITDGRGSTTDQNNRWPDILANRLQADPDTAHIAVLNHGIGGNAVVAGGLGPTLYSRFERDALDQPGVRWLIILEGVNDIGGSSSMKTAEDLIDAYRYFINEAHNRGLLVYGATILPFGGSGYYSPLREQIRQTVNDWIRTSGEFDAVIDFDAALRDPDDPEKLYYLYDSGDNLHPSAAGYQKMGETVDLSLFSK